MGVSQLETDVHAPTKPPPPPNTNTDTHRYTAWQLKQQIHQNLFSLQYEQPSAIYRLTEDFNPPAQLKPPTPNKKIKNTHMYMKSRNLNVTSASIQ